MLTFVRSELSAGSNHFDHCFLEYSAFCLSRNLSRGPVVFDVHSCRIDACRIEVHIHLRVLEPQVQ
jgi:hypothetical protein